MDNRRLILLLVFSFSLVMLWDGWQKHNKPPVPAVAATANSAAGVPTPTPGAAAAGSPALPGQNA
ncbi:membrane protein insertase YidC, partial [Enterobacter hormaechei]|nr:membrane protein insertase YidC [Enterobacter hormaechei]